MTTSLTERPCRSYGPGRGVPTPWGAAHGRWDYAPGIAFYSTAGHGGFKVNTGLNTLIPWYMRSGEGWYEEDCEWAIVAVCFPSAFTADERDKAEAALRNWFPDAWERFNGRLLKPGESSERDGQRHKAAAKAAGLYLPVSAFGDWHPSVPEGMVGVVAALGGERGNDAEWKGFLVPKGEYEPMTMTIAPGQYPEWPPPGR